MPKRKRENSLIGKFNLPEYKSKLKKSNPNKRNFLSEYHSPLNLKSVSELAHQYGIAMQTAYTWIINDTRSKK